jgi:methanogen homocitrate synthase
MVDEHSSDIGATSRWGDPPKSLAEDLHIYDVTLREGSQMAGVAFSATDRRAIAAELDTLGVEYIESGFPALSDAERTAVAEVTDEHLNATVAGLARADPDDVDAVVNADAGAVSIFTPGSDFHLQMQRNYDIEEEVVRARKAIEHAMNHGLSVRFAITDASRMSPKRLQQFVEMADTSDVSMIGVSDTVGCLHPQASRTMIEQITKWTDHPISVHNHNDLGLAVANTLAAAAAGATQLHTTINGLGANAGNTPLEPLAVALHQLYDRKIIDLEQLSEVSDLVVSRSGIELDPMRPVVGANAFRYTNESRIKGIEQDPRTYETYPPELVGRERSFHY